MWCVGNYFCGTSVMFGMFTSVVLWNIKKFCVWYFYFCGPVEYKKGWLMGCLLLWYGGIYTSVVLGTIKSVVLWNINKCGVWDVYFCGTVEFIEVWCLLSVLLWYCEI